MPTSIDPTRRPPHPARWACLGLIALVAPGCGGGPDDGLEKYPVRGRVLVNGQPAEGICVQFHKLDDSPPGNPSHPMGVTDGEGRFELSTNAEADGAIAGEYEVSFLWPSDHGPSAYDRLGGEYARPDRRITVRPEPNDVGVLEIKADLDAAAPKAPKGIPQ